MRWRRLVVLAGLVALVVVAARPVGLHLSAAATVVEGLGWQVPRPFAAEVERRTVELAGVPTDLYGIAAERPAILLAPGAAPAGRADPRVEAIATALARSGRVVAVPELLVYGEDLLVADIDRIAAVGRALADEHGQVVIAGLSFGGSLGLIAAARPELEGRVALVATFGAYADLAGVVQAVVTGVGLVDGERLVWQPDERAAAVVRDELLGMLSADQQRLLDQALEDGIDLHALPSELRSLAALLAEQDPAAIEAHLAAAPLGIRERIAAVSPARAAPMLSVPIVALHAVDDPIIPYAELRRLEATYPQTQALTLTTFDHLGPGEASAWETAQDLWRTTRFVAIILDKSQ